MDCQLVTISFVIVKYTVVISAIGVTFTASKKTDNPLELLSFSSKGLVRLLE